METMIKIKNSWLEKYFCKDIVSLEEIIGYLEDKLDEIDYLQSEIIELKNKQIEERQTEKDSDEYHEMKVLGLLK